MERPERRIGVATASMLVVASMVGTGVFTTTGFLVRDLGSLPAVIVAWALGGVVALCGALAYAELVSAVPENGGEYQLLGRIYHPSIGFLSGWVSFMAGFSAPIGGNAILFGVYLEAALPGVPALPSALLLIVAVSAVHALRVSVGGRFQDITTVAKVALIVAFIGAGLYAGDIGAGLYAGDIGRIVDHDGTPLGEAIVSPAFAAGLVYVSYAYTGWNAAAYVAGEVERPARGLPMAILSGTLIVTALYLGLNVVFLAAAPADTLARSGEAVADVAGRNLFGPIGGRLVSGLIAIGLVSNVGALVMTGPRVYEAVARDHPQLSLLTRRRPEEGPVVAVLLQAVVAIVVVLTASYDLVITYVGFVLSFISALTVAGVFVHRWREPGLERPYRAWGHPVTSILFVLVTLWMMLHALLQKPLASLAGLGTLVTGAIVYIFLQRRGPTRPLHP